MKNNSLLLLKVAVAAVLMFGLFSCASSKGCKGIKAHPHYAKHRKTW